MISSLCIAQTASPTTTRPPSSTSLTKLFVAGGYNIELGGDVTSVEVIDLSGQGLTCTAPSGLPQPNRGMSSLKTPAGNPLSCGGGAYQYEKKCNEYIPATDSWEEAPDLLGERFHSPTAVISGGRYWVVSSNDDDYDASSEIYDGTGFSFGPDIIMDTHAYTPCLARIDDDRTFYADLAAYIFDWRTMTFHPVASPMLRRMSRAHCGLARDSAGREMIVVAGGVDVDLGRVIREVMILDLETMTWRESSESLPARRQWGSVVPYGEDTFLVVGGNRGEDPEAAYESDVLVFNPDSEAWEVVAAIEVKRESVYAAMVDDSVVNCL